jgi:heterodisulfide reductase subunit A
MHKGIRTYGKQEVLYDEASRKGNIFLQFEEGKNPVVQMSNEKLEVRLNDILTENMEIVINPDLVVLVTGMVARNNDSLKQVLKIPLGSDKFFNEIHPKLRPVETVMDGIFIGGACQSPRNITETMTSSLAAAAKANSLISKGTITLEPNLVIIDKEKCIWCGKCEEICSSGAIVKVASDEKTLAGVIDAACKGCGACLPVCPEDAIELLGYTNSEIESMIDAISEEVVLKKQKDDWDIKVEKLDDNSKKILKALETEPKTIPEISEEVNIPSKEVTYLLMSLRKYGYISDTNNITKDEYYTYALNH